MDDFEQHRRRQALLNWYDSHGRTLPWRARQGVPADPYLVWLSEIMLQQTTVVTVKSYFRAFTDRWPTLDHLSAAKLDDVLHAWQGLGYYARARNLHKCAITVSKEYGGCFPDNEQELLKLPGIGPYTAAAIAAIAFNRRAAPVDGNIERVFARLLVLEQPAPGLRREIAPKLFSLIPEHRPGDFVQALMDLGAMVCTPGKPRCGICPWSVAEVGGCRALAAERTECYPVKRLKKKKPTRLGVAFWAENGEGWVFLRRRAERGLLGGMMEVPSTDWRETPWDLQEVLARVPFKANWRLLPGVVRHTFTHFHLELTVCIGRVASSQIEMANEGDVWSPVDGFKDYALPTVMKKIVCHASVAREKCADLSTDGL